MQRRNLLAGLAGAVATVPFRASEGRGDDVIAEPTPVPAAAIAVAIDQEFPLNFRSAPLVYEGAEHQLIGLGTGVLTLDRENRLRAVVNASIVQLAKVDYWISLAAFDEGMTFLGAATRQEAINYIRLGIVPTLLPKLEFDFGISKAYRSVARLMVAISERELPA